MADPRFEAYKILLKIEKEHSYSVISVTEALKSVSFSDSRDTAFTVSLVYGVLERKLTIDYNISVYLTSSVNRLKTNVLTLLRLGAYQLLYMDKIPSSAAVNESVKLTKKIGANYASGLVNAVLRKISENGLLLPDENERIKFLSISHSVNEDIIYSLTGDYGYDKTVDILSAFSGRRPIFIRCNTLKCSVDELIIQLNNENVYVESTEIYGCLKIDRTGDITNLKSFKRGLFYVQDMSSQLCCKLVDGKPGERIVDCCAAPGGKSFTISQYLQGTGEIISCDIHEHKKHLIEEGASRLGIENLKAVCQDARDLCKTIKEADRVLCDVPCSGFGVIGRKPEIRYKEKSDFCSLPELQKEILFSCAKMVRSGGILVYSTCTLNKNENEQICDSFLSENKDFSVACDAEYRKYTEKYLTVFPENNSGDGFFIAKFIRC